MKPQGLLTAIALVGIVSLAAFLLFAAFYLLMIHPSTVITAILWIGAVAVLLIVVWLVRSNQR